MSLHGCTIHDLNKTTNACADTSAADAGRAMMLVQLVLFAIRIGDMHNMLRREAFSSVHFMNNLVNCSTVCLLGLEFRRKTFRERFV